MFPGYLNQLFLFIQPLQAGYDFLNDVTDEPWSQTHPFDRANRRDGRVQDPRPTAGAGGVNGETGRWSGHQCRHALVMSPRSSGDRSDIEFAV